MNITGSMIGFDGSSIAGTLTAITTQATDLLTYELPLPGLSMSAFNGTVKVKVVAPGQPWTVGTPGGCAEFCVVVPPPMDQDGDGDVDGGDVGAVLANDYQQTNGGKLGDVLAQYGATTQMLGWIDLSGAGAGMGQATGMASGGTVTPYSGDGAVFRINLPVTTGEPGANVTVMVDIDVK